MFFDRGTFWVLPLAYFCLPKSARAYLFPICQNSLPFERAAFKKDRARGGVVDMCIGNAIVIFAITIIIIVTIIITIIDIIIIIIIIVIIIIIISSSSSSSPVSKYIERCVKP